MKIFGTLNQTHRHTLQSKQTRNLERFIIGFRQHTSGGAQEQLFVQIHDTRQGIAPEALPGIFDQFYQVEDLTTTKLQGSGVGLALTGHSTSEFVHAVRLNKARKLLQTTDMNVSEVSYEVGISNPAYFSRIYTELFGEAPRKTRR